MIREPKAMREIHKIQEKIYQEEKKMSTHQRIARIHIEAEALRKKYDFKIKSSVS